MAKKKVFSIGNALAESMEETIVSAHSYSGELRVEVIPIKRIELDPDNPRDLLINLEDIRLGIAASDPDHLRKMEELQSLQSIANSIKDQGIINPIVVYKYNEKYRIIAGERRTLASLIAGKSDIQAKILDNRPDELKISLLQWIENIERSDLSLWERLKNLEKIVATYASKKNVAIDSVTITELSNLIGCSKPHAMHYKAVLNADNHIKRLIFENKIRNLEKAALIAEIPDSAIREHAVLACLNGATLKKIKVIAQQSHVKPKPLKLIKKRGRQACSIYLGATKNSQVARFILDSILNNHSLAHLAQQFQDVDWNDHRTVTETFKQLVLKLEQLHA